MDLKFWLDGMAFIASGAPDTTSGKYWLDGLPFFVPKRRMSNRMLLLGVGI